MEEFFGEFFWVDFFGRNFFGRIFLGGFFWEDFWEEYFGRNYLVEINKELMFLSRFCGNFVSRQKEGRKKISILRSASASISHFKMLHQILF